MERPPHAQADLTLEGYATPSTDSFTKVFGLDRIGCVQVSNGAGNFQDSAMCAGVKAQKRYCGLQELFAFGGNRAVFANHLCRICAFECVFFSALNRCYCLRASITRARVAAESLLAAGARNCLYFTEGTSIWISMRSRSEISRRIARSSAPCSGVRGSDRRNNRMGRDSSPPPT
jgi:hypothetical protein